MLTSTIGFCTCCLKGTISEMEDVKEKHHSYKVSQKKLIFKVTKLTNYQIVTSHFRLGEGVGGIGLKSWPLFLKTPTVFWFCFW